MRIKHIIVGTLIITVILALGGLGGYLVGNMHKSQDVDHAKTTAKLEALQQVKTEAEKVQQQAPAKPAAETTCNADELSLAMASSSQSGAGTLAYDIIFTNVGKRTCALGGFPGVSLVNDNGNQIGTPAARTTSYTEKKVPLAPNTKVKAVLSTSNSANFSDGQCKTGATKLRVYPPNDTGYLSVATTIDSWCPGFEISPILAM
jgi:hypothetical protein